MEFRVDYAPFTAEPIPERPGSHVGWEPKVIARVVGRGRKFRAVRGLLDTGAGITILPGRLIARLDIEVIDRLRLASAEGEYHLPIGRVDLAFPADDPKCIWSAVAAFDDRREDALWGQVGFLEHFVATFDTANRFAVLESNGTFPLPPHSG